MVGSLCCGGEGGTPSGPEGFVQVISLLARGNCSEDYNTSPQAKGMRPDAIILDLPEISEPFFLRLARSSRSPSIFPGAASSHGKITSGELEGGG
ncbi:Hypothetical protein NTJ_05727 [Nesidiocoris tenuis]|uniref:Uncharacterized protein n=1 Tax=Nesidiocoris tenuis TaxID=355587 RepID=A0ABN7ALV1_9HEMI|nr:Hypothetical protein NTJ_05727 [Nesidiocoris tenuis]